MPLLCLEYVLPLRWDRSTSERELGDLAGYLGALTAVVDVTVVDGSGDSLFDRHHEHLSPVCRHVPPTRPLGLNGKVAGVVTGVALARHEKVVVADDDIRHEPSTLDLLSSALDEADLVCPQCYFAPATWHTRWDTPRSLLNRAVIRHDYPGTYGVRRPAFLSAGGYDGDVMFENLEMARTLSASGAVVAERPDIYVRRLPPTAAAFRGQRVRQAYDDFAQPARLLVEVALLPMLLFSVRRSWWPLLGWLLAPIALAELGRRRHGGTAVFEASASLWAPPWVCERAVCAWLALAHRCAGGVPYRGRRVRLAAHSPRVLRRQRRDPLVPAAYSEIE